MKNYLKRLNFLLASFMLALLLLSLARILFLLLNKDKFIDIGICDFSATLLYGLRFDIVTATIINALFIFLLMFPFSFVRFKPFRTLLKFIFMSTNLSALAINMVDMQYFPYTLRRSTAETFAFFFQKNDAGALLPLFVKDFWYMFIIFFLFALGLSLAYNIIKRKLLKPYTREVNNVKNISLRTGGLAFIGGLSVLAVRGGTQLIPLGIIDAGNFVKPAYVPLVLNTPFCLIKSGVLYTLEEKNYMSEAEANAIINPIKKYKYPYIDFKKWNVVVVIIESFSKEYTKLGNRKSYTPFLDSLMDNSLVYTHAFANGKRSVEGIPAIVASIPSFQFDYISTVYSNNKIMSLANILKTMGYGSAFFHGGTNGTMNFNGFCATAGYDRYFGRTEYDNENDYDGNWGIWDEPFLQRMAQELDKEKQPFLSTVFTLNSHHPFSIPSQYKNKFPEGKLPIYKCISYMDYSLKHFFNTAKKSAWFKNTLFVFTGDHTGPSEDAMYANSYGNYQVPIFFYLPDNSLKGKDTLVAQQLDIMPTTLSLLKYNQPFFSFGNDLTDSSQNKNRFAINYYSFCYQYYTQDQLLQFNSKKTIAFYDTRTDSLLNYNLFDARLPPDMDKKVKAFVQQYDNRVIHNNMGISGN
jgi:phosphoglycerol transferase MdoB-like AlkP superfamily enzyme